MRTHCISIIFLACACCIAHSVNGAILPREGPLWGEARGLEQLQQHWRILQGRSPGPEFLIPVTSGGPLDPVSVNPGELAEQSPTKSPFKPFFRFDLITEGQFQGGQANGPFQDELPFTPHDLPDPDLRIRTGAGFLARLSPHWAFWQRTIVDSDPVLDPASRTKEFHQIGAAVEIPEAVLVYEKDEIAAWIGRRWERWGPGWTGSLILEPGAPAPDGFGYSWTRPRWSLRYRCGRLDDFLGDELQVSRFLAGHRLDFSVSPTLRIGLAETSLTSSESSVPFWMLNPLLPWSMAQSENRGPTEGSNILWSMDAIWNPTPSWAVYGQFLLDDYMIDSEDRGTHPDQLGFLAGLLWTSRSSTARPGPWRIGLEYTRLGSWTYVHRDPQLRYRSWGSTLGHPAGPDSESATLICSRSELGISGMAMVWARWHRQGQVWLDTPLGPVGSAGDPWPTPPVNRWWQFGATLRARPLAGLTTTLRGGWTDIRSDLPTSGVLPGPASSEAGQGFWASLTLSLPLLVFQPDL